MLLKDDHEEKRRKSIKRERRKVREKGGKEAPMQMENIKMYEKTEKSEKTRVIYMSPQGKKLDQQKVEELSKQKKLILLCGHYEGIDQRVLDTTACDP